MDSVRLLTFSIRRYFTVQTNRPKSWKEAPGADGATQKPPFLDEGHFKDEEAAGEEEELSFCPCPFIDSKAFYGPFGRIVEAIAPLTEADPAAVLIQLLVGWGNLIGRSAFFQIGGTKHFTNLFCCIVGRTAKARKGLALGVAQWILDRIDPLWVKCNIRSGLSSGEGPSNE
jgi:hypothetical protein